MNTLHSNLILAFVTLGNDWMVYLGVCVGILDHASGTLFRSIISKNVQANEIGKAYSVVGIFETILPFATAPTFGFLYKATVEKQPNAFIFFIIGLKAAVLLIMINVFIQFKLERRRTTQSTDAAEAKQIRLDAPIYVAKRKLEGIPEVEKKADNC